MIFFCNIKAFKKRVLECRTCFGAKFHSSSVYTQLYILYIYRFKATESNIIIYTFYTISILILVSLNIYFFQVSSLLSCFVNTPIHTHQGRELYIFCTLPGLLLLQSMYFIIIYQDTTTWYSNNSTGKCIISIIRCCI